jgi:hypothetical protein
MLGFDPRLLTNVAVLVSGSPAPPSADRVVLNGDPVTQGGMPVVFTPPE